MKRIRLFLTLLLAFVVQISFAQEKEIKGTVSDESGPLPGVNVIVKGTNKGTQTDFDGNFTLKKVKKGDVIQFSYVGMTTVEKKVGKSKVMNVKMKSENTLEEVVIVGYGTAKKESLTGSVKQVKAEAIQSKAASSIDKALSGEVAGVQVINSSGQPGSNATVRIRGIGSLGGSNAPLYVVDGVPYTGNINAINQSDIETYSVLKDASATAIYGSRGANGVIVITTKKGKKGKNTIEIESKLGVTMELLPRYDVISSPEEYIEISYDALNNFWKTAYGGYYADNSKKMTAKYLFDGSGYEIGINPWYNMWKAEGKDLIDPNTGKFVEGIERRYDPERWDKYLFQTGLRQETVVKLSGGNDKTKYYTSIGYLDDNGYAIKSNFNRVTGRLNLTHEVKDWLKGSVNMTFIEAGSTNSPGAGGGTSSNSFFAVNNMPPIYPMFERDAKGNKVKDIYYGGYKYDLGYGDGSSDRPNGTSRGFMNDNNPRAAVEYDYNRGNGSRFIGDSYLEATLLEGLTLSSRFGLQYVSSNGISRRNPFYSEKGSKGSIYKSNIQARFLSWTKILRYKTEIDDHNIEALLAHENSEQTFKGFTAYKTQLTNPFGNDLDNAVKNESAGSYTDKYSLESIFGQLNYEYAQKYITSLTFRRDGSSKFQQGKWSNFGALGLAWRLSREDFLMDSDVFKELKLKASYGLVGSQGGVGYYSGNNFYSIGNLNGKPSLLFSSKGNPDLTWETSKMFQTGIEFKLWDVLEGNIDYYIKDTEDMFYNKRLGPSIGFASIKVNDGSMRNSGLEFDLKAHIVNTNDFKFDFVINGEMIKNEITKMPKNSKGKEIVLNGGYAKGHSIYEFYMEEYAGVNAETGLSQWWSYYDDKNGNGTLDDGEQIRSMTEYLAENNNAKVKKEKTEKYSDATRKFIEGVHSNPDVRGAFSLFAEYKGFSLGAQFLYSLGAQMIDGQYRSLMQDTKIGGNNWHVDIRNRWQKPGDKTDIPRLSSSVDKNVTSISTRFLTKADYLALNNIKLGYSLPKRYTDDLKLKKLSFFFSGDNLWIATYRKGFNPSTGGNTGRDYNPLSTVTFGVNVQF